MFHKKSFIKYTVVLLLPLLLNFSCKSGSKGDDNTVPVEPPKVEEVVYNEAGCLYTTVDKLVMAGYQGWFAAEGDESKRGWYHYRRAGKFEPNFSSVDFWPDVTEYTRTYKTAFKYSDGSDAYVFSPYDEETVDLHFKWMKDYGIDGVHMQRFVVEIKNTNPSGKRHFNKVLQNALKAAKKYGRAISVMYDLSGCTSADVAYLEQDWNELVSTFKLFDNVENPTYLRHKGKPLVTIWGVGFNDNRKYTIADVDKIVDKLKGPSKEVSIMLGVPYSWRTLSGDTENSPLLHTVIKKCDVIMPWAVGRYHSQSYGSKAGGVLTPDINWCKTNNIDYIPLVFPGFSWGNLKADASLYNQIPREKGDFLWMQVAGAKQAGAKSLYVAMFDEIDEGTAIFKTAKENQLPLNGTRKFVGIENDLQTDYYLWLTGEATKWFHGDAGYSSIKPVRP